MNTHQHLIVAESPPKTKGCGPGKDSAPLSNQAQPDFASDFEDCKAFASLRARLGSRGYSLQRLSDESLLIHRWNYIRPLADLGQAAAFLRQIGGAA